ncbi:FG-GAP repeat domain-containing protein [Nonomuraea turcica]|uniref:FG-GAP repeat domain-containing protein n=1 Tax=Nonomuraea sp. G32 TaxID=3067274 RepID=UPI00273B8591|nr:hypothetical protein [Nonomuraea sp. G32]MDP4510689.1 hypothetical protein [Nonomuraea sp. G32]
MAALAIVASGFLIALTPATPAAAGGCVIPDPFCNVYNNASGYVTVVDDWCSSTDDPIRGDTWPEGCSGKPTSVAPGGVGKDKDGFLARAGCITSGYKMSGIFYTDVTPFSYDYTYNNGWWHRFHDDEYIIVESITCPRQIPPPVSDPLTAPQNLRVYDKTSNTITLAWDVQGGTYYRVYRGGTEVGVTQGALYRDASLASSTTYSYTVKACRWGETCLASYLAATTNAGSGSGSSPQNGQADMIGLYNDNTLHWYPGKGDSTFWSARDLGTANFKLMDFQDINSDGKADMIAIYNDNTLHWYPGKGDSTFWSARDLGTANFKLMSFKDINSDGKADMIGLYNDNTLHWYPGKGDGTFSSARDLGTANFKLMDFQDINSDGKADMIAIYNDNTLHWYPGKGDGTFWSARDLGTANFKLMDFQDINSDGKADMIGLYNDDTLHWYPGKGDGTFWSARYMDIAHFKLMTFANIG